MLTLPKDLIRYFSSFLLYDDLKKFESTCKYIKQSLNSDFWLNRILTDYPNQDNFLSINNQNDSKSLYKHLTGKSIVFNKSSRYPKNKFQPWLKLRRGDVVHFGFYADYRNENKYMWTGKELINLDFTKDDYGAVPSEFCFPEFRPDHFIESIVHNSYINFTEAKLKQVQNNFNAETQMSYVTDRYRRYDILIEPISIALITFSRIPKNLLLQFKNDRIEIVLPYTVTTNESTINIYLNTEWEECISNIIYNEKYYGYKIEINRS